MNAATLGLSRGRSGLRSGSRVISTRYPRIGCLPSYARIGAYEARTRMGPIGSDTGFGDWPRRTPVETGFDLRRFPT